MVRPLRPKCSLPAQALDTLLKGFRARHVETFFWKLLWAFSSGGVLLRQWSYHEDPWPVSLVRLMGAFCYGALRVHQLMISFNIGDQSKQVGLTGFALQRLPVPVRRLSLHQATSNICLHHHQAIFWLLILPSLSSDLHVTSHHSCLGQDSHAPGGFNQPMTGTACKLQTAKNHWKCLGTHAILF